MRRFLFTCLALALLGPSSSTALEDVAVLAAFGAGGPGTLRVELRVPEGQYAYQKETSISAGRVELSPVDVPQAARHADPFSGELVDVYDGSAVFTFSYAVGDAPFALSVGYQTCDADICYLPQERSFWVTATAVEQGVPEGMGAQVPDAATAPPRPVMPLLDRVTLLDSKGGYMDREAFLAFIDGAGRDKEDALTAAYAKGGVLLLILLILLGGVALNLTPCVLPMIPINLAIIGAGANAGSRTRGFLLGGTYGMGMAMVYGLLGVVVVRTGSSFGSLQSQWWFNAAMALLFVLFALAMFDVFTIDLSRFQRSGGRIKGGRFVAAGVFGAVAALLAGACVAPVLLSVLLLSANLYAEGVVAGLALPFLLGIGMALPWPFAGAGLSFLPRPGAWMNHVKHLFGILIAGFAIYYGWLGYSGASEAFAARDSGASPEAQLRALSEAVDRAQAQNKPVLVDFWATWCKACKTMEKKTLSDEVVKQRLASEVVFVKFQAENPKHPLVKDVMTRFGVQGLPGFVLLEVTGDEDVTR